MQNAKPMAKLQMPNAKPQMQNVKPQMQNAKPQIQNTKPQMQNTKPQMENGKPQMQNTKPQIQNAKPQTQSAQVEEKIEINPEIRKRSYDETGSFKENFEVYLQALISQCLDPNFLSGVIDDKGEYYTYLLTIYLH